LSLKQFTTNHKLEVDNFILGVMVSPDKVVEELSIALRVKNYQDFLPQVSSDIESQITRIDMRDSPLCFLLVDLAQHIEALGSFWFGIKNDLLGEPKKSLDS
jgi:hypothetical protein